MNLHMVETADIRKILATRARTKFAHRVDFKDLQQSRVDEMTQWCEKNCQGLWNSHNRFAHYFQFDNERDAMLFMLKYGQG